MWFVVCVGVCVVLMCCVVLFVNIVMIVFGVGVNVIVDGEWVGMHMCVGVCVGYVGVCF